MEFKTFLKIREYQLKGFLQYFFTEVESEIITECIFSQGKETILSRRHSVDRIEFEILNRNTDYLSLELKLFDKNPGELIGECTFSLNRDVFSILMTEYLIDKVKYE